MKFRKMMSVLTLTCMFALALAPVFKPCYASEYFAESFRDYP